MADLQINMHCKSNAYLYHVIEVIQLAEFCLDCWNKINETHDSKWRYVFSWNSDLCEECGQYKRVIIVERFWSRAQRALTEVIENIQLNRKSKILSAKAFRISVRATGLDLINVRLGRALGGNARPRCI